ncbi:hypothetical protein LINPERHAP2_LOCUS16378 [Linum perenne]
MGFARWCRFTGPLSSVNEATTQESASKLIYSNLSSQNIGYDVGSIVLSTKGCMRSASHVVGMVTRLKLAQPLRRPNPLRLNLWKSRLIIRSLRSWILDQRLKRTLVRG